jgi:DNA-binding NtrC family response regulator
VARTLLVEDDEAVRGILARTLVAAGYEVEEAANGEVALAAYRRQASDVVITDLVMPEKNGLEMIMEMRRLDPGVKIIGCRVAAGRSSATWNVSGTSSRVFASSTPIDCTRSSFADRHC